MPTLPPIAVGREVKEEKKNQNKFDLPRNSGNYVKR